MAERVSLLDLWDGSVSLIDDHQAVDLDLLDGMLRRVIVCCDCGLVHLMSIDVGSRRAYFVRDDGPLSTEIRERGKASGHFFPREKFDVDADHEWALWHEKWCAAMDLVGRRGDDVAKAEAALERIRALWPHIEVPVGPQRFLHGKREVADPGAPTCLRCKIEEAIRG